MPMPLSLDALIQEEGLKPVETRQFVARALREGRVSPYGTALAAILPPMSRFAPDGRYHATKQRVLDRLAALVAREIGQTAPASE